MMNGHGKSDGSVVPAKSPNNGGGDRLDLGRPMPSPAEGATDPLHDAANRLEPMVPGRVPLGLQQVASIMIREAAAGAWTYEGSDTVIGTARNHAY
jgi:hypothetical protein